MKNHKEIVRHISLGGENGNTQVHSSSVDSADIFCATYICTRYMFLKLRVIKKYGDLKKKEKLNLGQCATETTFSILFQTF